MRNRREYNPHSEWSEYEFTLPALMAAEAIKDIQRQKSLARESPRENQIK